MSIRESRLCDTEVNDRLCPQAFANPCPLCQQDRCTVHFGATEVKIAVELNEASRGMASVLGYARFIICVACAKRLSKVDVNALVDPAYALLAAKCAENALKEK